MNFKMRSYGCCLIYYIFISFLCLLTEFKKKMDEFILRANEGQY